VCDTPRMCAVVVYAQAFEPSPFRPPQSPPLPLTTYTADIWIAHMCTVCRGLHSLRRSQLSRSAVQCVNLTEDVVIVFDQ
jgi:hypothetical protein